ncbi:hypothetical protein MKW94_012534 [Papaver nudicaule]|uniref:MADS-box domain-containing protein n=1 Tax=Papaver nudicaule TaxID=74823 RepID=A0AA41SIL7_PAPNU|nr:hypothetical protein [Papaver nudicaule]
MGRKKLPMELIQREKNRNETYRKRKQGLIKKLKEFTVLCEVEACMIAYGPKLGDRPVEVETWPAEKPEDIDTVHKIIERYRKVPEEDKQKRRQDLYDFFQARKKTTEVDLNKLRKKHDEFQFFDHEQFQGLDAEQLHQILQRLGSKMESVDQRIQQKKNQDITGTTSQYPNVAPHNETPYSMPNTSYDHGTVPRNDLLYRQQLGHAASTSHGDFSGQLFGGQGVSLDHNNDYKKRKINDYHFCDSNSVMFGGAPVYATYNPATFSFGYPGSSTLNMMPTPGVPISWMPSAGYPSQVYYNQQPSGIMQQQGSSLSHEPQQLFTMNAYPMTSAALRQSYHPSEESFGIQD